MAETSLIWDVLNTPAKRAAVQQQWLRNLAQAGSGAGTISKDELAKQTEEFLELLGAGLRDGSTDIEAPAFKPLREFLQDISRSRAQLQGFSTSETALFIFSFKQPLFEQLRGLHRADAEALAKDIWAATRLVDSLGMHTVKSFQLTREAIIRRQQEEMLELSTPVVKLWEGILALPMI